MSITKSHPIDEQEVLVSYVKTELARLFEGGDDFFFGTFDCLLKGFIGAKKHKEETRRLAKALIGPYRRTGFEEIFCHPTCPRRQWYDEKLHVSEFILPDMEDGNFFNKPGENEQDMNYLRNLKEFIETVVKRLKSTIFPKMVLRNINIYALTH